MRKTANRTSSADLAVEFIKPDSAEAAEINRVLLKEVEKPKFRPTQIVKMMMDEGFSRFTMHSHSELWKSLNAQDPAKGAMAFD